MSGRGKSQVWAEELGARLREGRVTRREFLRLSAMLGVSAVSSGALAACGPSAGGESTESVQLVYQDWRTDWFPGMAQEVLQQFHSNNPNINVFYQPDPENLPETMVEEMQAGTAADVFQGCCTFMPRWAQLGHVMDLTELIARDIEQSTIDDWDVAQYAAFRSTDGVRFALPKYRGGLALYYNKDLFDEYGVDYPDYNWDHEKYAEAMKALTHDRDGDGETDLWGSMLDISWERIQVHINGWGGHIVDPNDAKKSLLAEPEAMAAMQWIYDRMWVDRTMASFRDVQNIETRQAFIQGHVAMVEDGSWALKDILTNTDFRVGVAPFPAGPVRRATLATTDGFGIYAGTKHPEAAWELLKFLVSPEYGRAMAKANFLQPARASIVPDWSGFVQEQFPEKAAELDVAAFADGHIKGYSVTTEVFEQMNEAEPLVQEAWNKIFTLNQADLSLMEEVSSKIEASQ
ncbi:MAG TPA: sugar ABC transporter substrate-binding protein [Anaerolineae bacterium]|nr:sugar ABC transporter substrate-binding protein [Anaerolineae bacterium]